MRKSQLHPTELKKPDPTLGCSSIVQNNKKKEKKKGRKGKGKGKERKEKG